MKYTELSANQLRVAQDCKQVFEAYQDASQALQQYQGWLSWKTVGAQEYLIKVTNRHGGNRSLGPRSAETEKIYEDFYAAKGRISERHAGLKESLKEVAGMARGVGVNRVPKIVAATLRALKEKGLLGRSLIVIGTNAMYAYESAAGVRFDAGLLATMDIDFLWDARVTLKLGAQEEQFAESGLMAVLQNVDKSFEVAGKNQFRAVNKEGFYVDLVKQGPNPPWKKDEPEQMAPGDLVPAWLPNIKWLLSSEKFSSLVIGQDGIPAPMVAPDPRAFAVYKSWLSKQAEREPEKRARDEAQGLATLELVKDRFPHLKLDVNAERMFPKAVRSGLGVLHATKDK